MMKTIGRRENVKVRRTNGRKWGHFEAKIDTGAKWSRIGVMEAAILKLGPIEEVSRIPATVRIGGRQVTVRFTVSTGKEGVLIGRRTLRNRFKVDAARKHLSVP